MAYPLHRGDRPGFQVTALHDRSIELHLAGLVEVGAAAGVERRVVLEDPDHTLDDVERRASRLKEAPALHESLGDSRTMRPDAAIGHVPRAAVNRERTGQSSSVVVQ